MANLRVDKITSTETFERTGSVQFDGSGDYLSLPVSSDFQFGSGDFTIECWALAFDEGTDDILGIYNTGSNRRTFALRKDQTESMQFLFSSNGSSGTTIDSADGIISLNTWHHYAVVRKDLEYTIYLDGKKVGSRYDSGAIYTNTNDGLRIGSSYNTDFDGHISNVRIIKGKALYTKNFKVPMKELEATPETVLLCCQSKTSAAAAKVSPNISGVNDGTIWSDALDVTNGGRLRHQDFGDGQTYSPSLIFDGDTSTDAEGPNGTNNNIIYDFENLLGKSIPVSSSIKIVIGGSDGRTLKVNGTTIGTNLGSAVQTITNQSALNKIEVVAESSSRSGRLADIKVDDVSLLLPVLPFGRNINASELSPGLLTDKVVDGGSSAIKGSVEFNGGGAGQNISYLQFPPADDDLILSGDFTIELWIRPGSIASSGSFHIFANQAQDTTFQYSNSDTNVIVYDGSNRTLGSLDKGEWAHVAIVRSGSTLQAYKNGNKFGASWTNSSTTRYTFSSTLLGARWQTGNNFDGFISNFRVNKGTALYTADFIPPTRELKKVPGTVLLCCQDPNNPLTEVTGKTITPYGNLGDGSLGGELVTNDSVWTLTKGGSGATDWTVSDQGRSLAGTTVTSGFIRATYTLDKGDYLVSLRWTGGTFAVQDSTGYIITTSGIDTDFAADEDGAYSFYVSNTTSVIITGTAWNTAYTVDDISIKRIYKNNGASNFTPQVGDDRKVTFEGVTKINTENYFYLPTGNTESRYLNVASQATSAARGLRSGGQTPSVTNTIDFTTIPTRGNSLDFGNLTAAKFGAGGIGSPTRGLFCGGGTPTRQSAIDYITIASEGDAQDFGDLFGSARTIAGASGGNSVRGLTFGGATAASTVNIICYVTIATTGNGQDFGDCTQQNGCAVICSPTRAVSAGGDSAANGSHINTIEFVTIQSMGNTLDFGDLLSAGTGRGVSSATRGVFSTAVPSAAQTLTFLTMATGGNVIDFGDLISNNASGGCAAYSSPTRGIFAGMRTPTVTNVCEFITIASTGNATDFGDLITTAMNGGGLSNGHGGLG